MESIVQLIANYLGRQVERSVKQGIAPAVPYLRGLAFGVALVLVSAPLFSLAFIAIGGAVFAAFAGYNHFIVPALWTALVFAVIAILVLTMGLGKIRRPR